MSRLSISQAWDESKLVLAREGRLLIAVALALFVLPGVVLSLFTPAESADGMPKSTVGIVAMLVLVVISLAGQLAIVRLAMGPHITVGEAIAHGFRRMAAYLGSVLIWMLPLVMIVGVLYGVMQGGASAAKGLSALAIIALVALFFFVAVRMVLASPVASAEPLGSIAILQRSWRLTGGSWWRLFAFLAMFLVAAIVLLVAVGTVTGLVAKTVFGGTEPMSVGGLLVALVSQTINAGFSVVFFVMLARIYVQLAGGREAQASVPSSAD